MEATLYAEKLKKIKVGYRIVLSHIAKYTSEDVHIMDKDFFFFICPLLGEYI